LPNRVGGVQAPASVKKRVFKNSGGPWKEPNARWVHYGVQRGSSPQKQRKDKRKERMPKGNKGMKGEGVDGIAKIVQIQKKEGDLRVKQPPLGGKWGKETTRPQK